MDVLKRIWNSATSNLNFFRVHVLVFSFTPLIFAIVFWAANPPSHKVSFIDSLFLCVTSLTVTGLATNDLSPLSRFQQALLFTQTCLGSPVVVSWVVVYIRRSIFRRRFGDVVLQRLQSKAAREGRQLVEVDIPPEALSWKQRFTNLFVKKKAVVLSRHASTGSDTDGSARPGRLRVDMIRRIDGAPQLVNPSGWISEQQRSAPPRPSIADRSLSDSGAAPPKQLAFAISDVTTASPEALEETNPTDSISDAGANGPAKSPNFPRRPTITGGPDHNRTFSDVRPALTVTRTLTQHDPERFPRSPTVEFVHPGLVQRPHARRGSLAEWREVDPEGPTFRRRSRSRSELDRRPTINRGPGFPATSTMHTTHTMHTSHTMHTNRTRNTVRNQDRDFGGFPMPHQIVGRIIHKLMPGLGHRLRRTVTIPRTTTLTSHLGGSNHPGARQVPYITFDALVGRNSLFHGLTEEHMHELGGVEYRALTLLLWIVAGYHIGLQLIGIAIIVPYIQRAEWRHVFDDQVGYVSPAWFGVFQVASAYTNAGTSLCDTSMVPFRTAYPMLVVMFFLILAGNTGFPVFLRFTIWIFTKLVPKQSRTNETLHFLLDHPRRCYIYLFPSHQTWFLFTVVVLMIMTDWLAFLVLDIGTPEVESVPLKTRVAIGLLQAAAVRAAGFATVSLSALAPAVKVLYVTMMYVAVYPVALSVRSTNVYEEQSLGIFEEDTDSDTEPDPRGHRAKVWGNYLIWHARKQLSFDMWWLGFALWLLCIIEKHQLTDTDKDGWFSIFPIIFELVSAYGTVGLSLGTPLANYSLSGTFSPLSKFIIILVMLRGRHRGLPVAIDRAVLLPGDLSNVEAAVHAHSIDDGQDHYERVHHSGVPMEKVSTTHSQSNGVTNDHPQLDTSPPAIIEKPRLDTVHELASPLSQVQKRPASEDSSTAASN